MSALSHSARRPSVTHSRRLRPKCSDAARASFAGAVDASVGAKRVLHEVKGATMERTGMFVNCEDGLQIPW